MTEPHLAAWRFFLSTLAGMGLGLWYGFLRPLRPRFTALSDFVFLLGAGAVWLWMGFSLCEGDLRMGSLGALYLGGFLWEGAFGRLLRPVFFGFWKGIRRILEIFLVPVKKISKNAKFLFAS